MSKFDADVAFIANELDRLQKTVSRYKGAMEQVIAELEEDFDINANGGPNKAMRLANELKEALFGPGGY